MKASFSHLGVQLLCFGLRKKSTESVLAFDLAIMCFQVLSAAA